ncbi:MAG TPA: dTMP kinase [Steroidobacteraceae bacterium]|nr:dTMP kinase [Steroidobacteraceae bacterium]
MKGRFITLEGIEGAGKSTIAQYIARWLSGEGVSVLLTREPGGTPLAERVRQIVLERNAEPLSAVTETLLMFAARGLHVENVIVPALREGRWVVSDRFTDATRAYQGGGRGVDHALIDTLAGAVHPQLAPDCTLLLDVAPAVGLARARARAADTVDRFEAETLEFFTRVRARYHELARREPQRMHVIDASVPIAEVQRSVQRILAGLIAT